MVSIQILIGAISVQCYKLHEIGVDAFYNFYPHTQEIEIRLYLNGWKKGFEPSKSWNIYLDRTGATDRLIKVLDELKKL